MLEEWIRKGKEGEQEIWQVGKGKGKYLIIIAICIGLLALIWPVSKPQTKTDIPTNDMNKVSTSSGVASTMANELETILSQIDGAGVVEVSLTLTSEGVKTYASNIRDEKREIEETDNKGMKKFTTEQNLTKDLAVSSGEPLLVEEKNPDILGVLVVADGAKSPMIKERLTKATSTLLNISPHKVTVMPREGGV